MAIKFGPKTTGEDAQKPAAQPKPARATAEPSPGEGTPGELPFGKPVKTDKKKARKP